MSASLNAVVKTVASHFFLWMRIFVTIGQHRTLTFNVEDSETIDDLVARIHAHEDSASHASVRLIYGDDPELQWDKTLRDYGIKHSGVLHAVITPRVIDFMRKELRSAKTHRLLDRLHKIAGELRRLQNESDDEDADEAGVDRDDDSEEERSDGAAPVAPVDMPPFKRRNSWKN